MPVVKHEKTRKELAQPTDLGSTDFELDMVNIYIDKTNIVVLTNKCGFGQGSLQCYVITSQFHFCISILKKMLRCVITVVLLTMAANTPQLRCQKALF